MTEATQSISTARQGRPRVVFAGVGYWMYIALAIAIVLGTSIVPGRSAKAAPSDLAQCTQLMRLGSTGTCVVYLQEALNTHGASPRLATDGQFGPLTATAVRTYQASAGLAVDGIVGPATRGSLTASVPTPVPAPTIPRAIQIEGTVTSSIYVQRWVIRKLPAGDPKEVEAVVDLVAESICTRYFPRAGDMCASVLATSNPLGLLPAASRARANDSCLRIRYPRATGPTAGLAGAFYSDDANPAYCLRDVYGSIGQKWMSLGGRGGFLGYALTDELSTPNKPGRFNHFKNGSIYWSPTTGAHEVHGAILGTWARLGYENSHLGFPVTDEHRTPDKAGAFNHFEGGSIYWSPSVGRAHEVRGAIRDKWASMGWENSHLGFPTSDEYSVPGGRQSDFQGGRIFWDARTGQTYVR